MTIWDELFGEKSIRDSHERAAEAIRSVLDRKDGVARPVKDRRDLADWFMGLARACRAALPKEPK